MQIQALLLLPLALAALTTATPIQSPTKRASHATSTSNAFTLIANITDPAAAAALFNTTIDSTWAVAGVHVGAGLNAAILERSGAFVFYQNGTAGSNTAFVADSGRYPVAIDLSILQGGSIIGPAKVPPGETVYYAGINIGNGDLGLRVAPAGVAQALVGPPAAPAAGLFAVCNVTHPMYGSPQYPVRYLVPAVGGARLPDACVEVALLAQCATLAPVPAGALYDHAAAQTVPCYESVADIDWSAYAVYCGRRAGAAPAAEAGFAC